MILPLAQGQLQVEYLQYVHWDLSYLAFLSMTLKEETGYTLIWFMADVKLGRTQCRAAFQRDLGREHPDRNLLKIPTPGMNTFNDTGWSLNGGGWGGAAVLKRLGGVWADSKLSVS